MDQYNDDNREIEIDSVKQQNYSQVDEISELVWAQQQPEPRVAPPTFSPPAPAWNNGSRGISRCINRNTYIWLNNGNSFWFFPITVGRNAVIGFRWRGFGWVFQRIELRRIRNFQCF